MRRIVFIVLLLPTIAWGAEYLMPGSRARDKVASRTVRLWLPMAGCNNTAASPFWDLPTTNAPTAVCVTGSNIQKGALQYADSANQTAQTTIALPLDWNGNGGVDVDILSTSATTSSTDKFTIATGCRTPNTAVTDDPAFNTATTLSVTTSSVASGLTLTTARGISVAGCVPGALLHLKVGRDTTDADTAVVNAIGAFVTLRRVF